LGGLLEAKFSSSLLAEDADDRTVYDHSSGNILIRRSWNRIPRTGAHCAGRGGYSARCSGFHEADGAPIDLDLDIGLFTETPKDLTIASPAQMTIA
jgi:hypothetical protein